MADSADQTRGEAAVRLDRVAKRFGDTAAVTDASFALRRGRFLTILGPSGSGKTTVLRMIAGFIRPDAGEIYVDGRPVSADPPYKRSIGMVFQRLALFPHMTAAENVAYPLKMRRTDPGLIAARVEEYLELVQLGGLGRRRIQELSGGQQQRVAIARALVFRPNLLLLDEPLAALDKKLREEMQLEFRRIQQDLGVTTINVTHDQREALVMSDEIIVMHQGRIQQSARPAETYRNPANPFVAGFIGVTNFIAAEVVGAGDGLVHLRVGGLALTGRLLTREAPPSGRMTECALRAEQLRIGPPDALSGLDVILPAIVAEVIFEGDRMVYGVDCPALGGARLRIFDQDPLGHRLAGPGEAASIGWNSRDLMVFSADH